ncbi:MAG: hypothetical protein M0Z95_01735 [Actinomycetota bacterium]|nr:hypothetical protein [Actinomycetota bacterium]
MYIAILSAKFGIDIEDDLTAILPEADLGPGDGPPRSAVVLRGADDRWRANERHNALIPVLPHPLHNLTAT